MYTGPRTLGPSEECLTEGETWKQKNADTGLNPYRQIGSMDQWINGSMDQKPKIIDAKNHPKIQHAINPINSNKIVIFFMIKIHE